MKGVKNHWPKPRWRREYATYERRIRSSKRRANLVKCIGLISIAIVLRIVGSALSLVVSGRRSIVPATNSSLRVGGCNPVLTCNPTAICSPKTQPKVAKKFKRFLLQIKQPQLSKLFDVSAYA